MRSVCNSGRGKRPNWHWINQRVLSVSSCGQKHRGYCCSDECNGDVSTVITQRSSTFRPFRERAPICLAERNEFFERDLLLANVERSPLPADVCRYVVVSR